MDRHRPKKHPACSLCSQPFALRGYRELNFGSKLPRALKCGHSACESCIVKNLSAHLKIICSCGHESLPAEQCTENNLEVDFPPDLYTLGFCAYNASKIKKEDSEIGFMKTSTKPVNKHMKVKNLICHECRTDDAECICLQCNVHYCTNCFNKIHQMARAFLGHKLAPLPLAGEFDPHCPCHLDQQLEFLCNDCSESACSRCLIADHKGHNIDLLSDKNKSVMDELVDSHVRVYNHLKRLKCTRKKIVQEVTKKNLPSDLLEIKNDINQHFARLHGYLTIKQHDLISKIFQPHRNAEREIKTLLEKLDEEMAETNEVLTISDRLLKSSPKYVSSVNYSDVLSNLKEKEDSPCFFICKNNQKLFRFTADQSIFETIDNHCQLDVLEESNFEYSLVRKEELPSDYEIEPVNEITKDVLFMQDEMSRPRANSSTSHSSLGSIDDIQNSQLTEFSEGRMYPALFCHVISPSDFYIHRPGVARLLSNLHSQFKRMGTLKKHPPTDLIKGRIYLVKYGQDNQWYRGRVINVINCDTVEIFYIDYGNSEAVNRNRLRTIPSNLMNVGNLATHCRVYNCVPANGTSWNPEAVSLMAQLPKNGDISIVVKKIHPKIIDVDVIQSINNGDVSLQESLLFLGLAVLADSCDLVMITRKPIKSYPAPQVHKSGDTFLCRVTFIQSLHHFYVCDIDVSLKTYLNLKEELTKFFNSHKNCQKLKVYNPYKDMPVAVNGGSNHWFRAIILEVPAPKIVKVFLIDNGKVEIVSWDKIMIIPPNFLHYPPLVQRCSLSDLMPIGAEEWNQEVISAFQTLALDVNLKLLVDSVDGDVANVFLFTCEPNTCINTVLVKQNLAKTCGGIDSTAIQNFNANLIDNTKKRNEELPSALVQNEHVKETTYVNRILYFENPELDFSNPHFDKDNDSVRMKVTMMRIVSPDEFYVALTMITSQIKVMQDKMAMFYKKKENIALEKNDWKQDDICAVNVQVGIYDWHRALILEINEDLTTKVKLLDEGQEVTVPLMKLQPLNDQFTKLMEGVIRCHLMGLKSPMAQSWPYTTIAEFKELAENSNQLFMSKMGEIKDRSLPVELFIRTMIPAGPLDATKYDWYSINNRLRLAGYAMDDGTKEWSPDDNFSTYVKYTSTYQKDSAEVDSEYEGETLTDDHESSKEDLSDELTINNSSTEWIPAEPFGSLEFLANPSYVDHDAAVYIQDYQNSVLKLNSLNEELTKRYDGSYPCPKGTCWKVGMRCIARFHLDNRWYRGVIERINGDEISVRFVDYGNTEECDLLDLRKITMVTDLPIQCQPCYFYTIGPKTRDGKWPVDLLDYIHTSLVDKRCQISLCILSDEKGNRYGIKEMRMHSGRDFILQLVEEGHAKFVELNESASNKVSNSEDEVVIESDEIVIFPEKDIGLLQNQSEESNIEGSKKFLHWVNIINENPHSNIKPNYRNITIPEDVSSISVEMTAILSVTNILMTIESSNNKTLSDTIQKFEELMEKVQEEAPTLSVIEKPYLYQACCVKYSEDNKWYRGIVLQEYGDDRLLIQYVDYGNVEIIPVQEVRHLKEEWALVEVQAVMCILNDVRLKNRNQQFTTIQLLSDILQSKTLEARIKKRTEDCLYVELYRGDKLAYQDLIDEQVLEIISAS